jgi:hypothetical protein
MALSEDLPASKVLDGPIPLSFPAIIRNPGISGRFGHLREPGSESYDRSKAGTRNKRDENEGKRWIRRKENGPSDLDHPI